MDIKDFFNNFVNNPVVSYLTTGVLGGILGGLLLLGVQTLFKQGIAFQFKKKLEEVKQKNNENLRNIGHEYDKKLRDFNHEYDEKLSNLNHEYDKRLVSFNEKIAMEAERRKLDFDRKIHDFAIYSSKRYEVYPELFKKIFELQTFIIMKEDIDSLPSYVQTIETLEIFLDNRGMRLTERHYPTIQRFFDLYKDAQKQQNNELMNEKMDLIKQAIKLDILSTLNIVSRDTTRFISGNMLYFSEDVLLKSNKLVSLLTEYCNPNIEFTKDAKAKIESEVEDFRRVLQQKLSIGDYSQ